MPRTDGQMELGARIAEARDLAGITQDRLASAISLDRTAIAKIESGTRRLGATELVLLADALDRPVDWFFVDSPAAVVSRRADPAVGRVSKTLDTRIERMARDIDFLQREGELPSVTRFSQNPPATVEEAEDAARNLREHLLLRDGPLLNLQVHAEKVGLFAFSVDLADSGGDAAYVAIGDIGVAVINGALEPGRRRFNLAHELGHHVFQDAYAPEVGPSLQDENERLINAFAVHLLLPRGDAKAIMSEFDPDYRLGAVAAAVRHRLSWTAVCSHLRNVEVIDTDVREELADRLPSIVDFLKLGERWVAELDAPSVPPQYAKRVLAAYTRGKLTAQRALELLWGTVDASDLPEQNDVPLEALRREFESFA